MPLVNTIAWSYSRQRMFEACERQYWFSYIGSWNGWRASGNSATRAIYLAKKLAGLPAEVGSIVHKVIRDALEKAANGITVDAKDEIALGQIALLQGILESMDPANHSPNISPPLPTRYLRDAMDEPFSDDEINAADARIGELAGNFFALPLVQTVLANPQMILIPFLDPPDPVLSECLGVPAYVKTDLVLKTSDGYCLIDWKTGRYKEEHRDQALVYDVYLRRSLKLQDSALTKVYCVYLSDSWTEPEPLTFTAEEREDALFRIHKGFEAMQTKSAHPVINTGHREDFPAQPSMRACRYCPFQVLCEEAATKVVNDPNF